MNFDLAKIIKKIAAGQMIHHLSCSGSLYILYLYPAVFLLHLISGILYLVF